MSNADFDPSSLFPAINGDFFPPLSRTSDESDFVDTEFQDACVADATAMAGGGARLLSVELSRHPNWGPVLRLEISSKDDEGEGQASKFVCWRSADGDLRTVLAAPDEVAE